jgi:hypothetical protein
LAYAQAFKEMEMKGQVGLNLQDGGKNFFFLLILNYENMSLGLTANYLLSVNEDELGNIPDFGQR